MTKRSSMRIRRPSRRGRSSPANSASRMSRIPTRFLINLFPNSTATPCKASTMTLLEVVNENRKIFAGWLPVEDIDQIVGSLLRTALMCAALAFRASAMGPVTSDAVRDAVLAAFETKDAAERARFEKVVDRFMSQHAAEILETHARSDTPATNTEAKDRDAVDALFASVAAEFATTAG